MTETVVVTGATGFLGGHIIKQLLQQNYRVIGTVHDELKGKTLLNLVNDSNFSIKPVDLLNADFLNEIFINDKTITKVIHTAHRFDFSIQDYDKHVIQATIDGTKTLLSAIERFGDNVTHIINTSCLAAHFTLEEYSNPSINLTEDDWCKYDYNEAKQSPFKANHYSKLESERLFWKFINNQSKFIGVSICPAFMFGPQPFDEYAKRPTLNTSSELINVVLKCGPDDLDKVPSIFGYCTDVRDVAKLQIDSFNNKDFNNKRLAPFAGRFSIPQVLNLAKDKFPKISDKLPPKCLIVINLLNFDNSKTNDLINFELTNVDQTLYDSVEQLLRVQNLI